MATTTAPIEIPPHVAHHVDIARRSYHNHIAKGLTPTQAFFVVISARAPYPEDDVLAAVVRAITDEHDRTPR